MDIDPAPVQARTTKRHSDQILTQNIQVSIPSPVAYVHLEAHLEQQVGHKHTRPPIQGSQCTQSPWAPMVCDDDVAHPYVSLDPPSS